MSWFAITLKLITSFFTIIWNAVIGIINFFISIFNKHARIQNEKIKRGITDIKKSSPATLFPYGYSVENTMISGGTSDIRAQLISQIVANASQQGYPVIIIHEGNRELAQSISNKMSGADLVIIDNNNPILEPFYTLSSKDISKLILETATPDYDLKKNASYYIEGMCDFLKYKKINPTIKAFNNCPHQKLFDNIDSLIIRGVINDTEGQSLKSKLMTGQSEQYKLETLFSDLYDQGEGIFSKTKGTSHYNIVRGVVEKKVIMVDISSNLNVLLLNILVAQLRQSIIKGNNLVFVSDELSTVGNELFKKVITERTDKCKTIVCNSDAFAMCNGDEKIFNTAVGNCEQIIILGHSSGTSCNKWAETIGYYDKEEESSSVARGKMKHSPFTLFPGSNNTITKNYNIKREYIVKPETINRMSYNEIYVYNHQLNKLTHTYLQ